MEPNLPTADQPKFKKRKPASLTIPEPVLNTNQPAPPTETKPKYHIKPTIQDYIRGFNNRSTQPQQPQPSTDETKPPTPYQIKVKINPPTLITHAAKPEQNQDHTLDQIGEENLIPRTKTLTLKQTRTTKTNIVTLNQPKPDKPNPKETKPRTRSKNVGTRSKNQPDIKLFLNKKKLVKNSQLEQI